VHVVSIYDLSRIFLWTQLEGEGMSIKNLSSMTPTLGKGERNWRTVRGREEEGTEETPLGRCGLRSQCGLVVASCAARIVFRGGHTVTEHLA